MLRNCIAAAKMPPVGLASLPPIDSATMDPMMKKRALAAASLAVLLSGSLTMGAGVSVKSVMRSWKVKANATSQMLSGGAHYDEAAIRESLRAFAAEAQAIDERLTGATAANRDMKMRFENFSADATAALDVAAASGQLKPRFARMIGACRSCHDQYAN